MVIRLINTKRHIDFMTSNPNLKIRCCLATIAIASFISSNTQILAQESGADRGAEMYTKMMKNSQNTKANIQNHSTPSSDTSEIKVLSELFEFSPDNLNACEKVGQGWSLASEDILKKKYKELNLTGLALVGVAYASDHVTGATIDLQTGVVTCLTTDNPWGKFRVICAKTKRDTFNIGRANDVCKKYADEGMLDEADKKKKAEQLAIQDEQDRKYKIELEKNKKEWEKEIANNTERLMSTLPLRKRFFGSCWEKFCHIVSLTEGRYRATNDRRSTWPVCAHIPTYRQCLNMYSNGDENACKEQTKGYIEQKIIPFFQQSDNDYRAAPTAVLSSDEVIKKMKKAKECE